MNFAANPDPVLSEALHTGIETWDARVGIIGMGYVGLPLACAVCARGFPVIGFEVDGEKVEKLNAGQSYIKSIPASEVADLRQSGRFRATGDFSELHAVDVVLICVPTPLTKNRDPDMSFITGTAGVIRQHLRRGQLVILESTTYPGTLTEVVKPILEESGLRSGTDFFLAYSPEREDPGNAAFRTRDIPKVVGGDGAAATELAAQFYRTVVRSVVTVSSAETAEAVKLTENIFRSVNIALVNELKLIFEKMGINIWEVIEAAKTKPFGFMPFYPGPGLGGHCIPIDPFYLSWKAREFDIPARFIELAGEINNMAPRHVVDALIRALSDRKRKSIAGARVLLLGIAYKKNVDDMRESPGLTLIDLLESRGAVVDYFDPFIPEIPTTREHPQLAGRKSVAWEPERFAGYDAVLICTDHDGVDYTAMVEAVDLVVDTRNATAAVPNRLRRVVLA